MSGGHRHTADSDAGIVGILIDHDRQLLSQAMAIAKRKGDLVDAATRLLAAQELDLALAHHDVRTIERRLAERERKLAAITAMVAA